MGPLDAHGLGWMGTFIGGLLVYLFTMRSGPLHLLTVPYFRIRFADGTEICWENPNKEEDETEQE